MTARMPVAERVARLRALTGDDAMRLLLLLDATSPRAVDKALEYQQAAAEPAPGPDDGEEEEEVYVRAAGDDETAVAALVEASGQLGGEDAITVVQYVSGIAPAALATALDVITPGWRQPRPLASRSLRFQPGDVPRPPVPAADGPAAVSLASARAGRIGGTP